MTPPTFAHPGPLPYGLTLLGVVLAATGPGLSDRAATLAHLGSILSSLVAVASFAIAMLDRVRSWHQGPASRPGATSPPTPSPKDHP